jgi:hypothetical protein
LQQLKDKLKNVAVLASDIAYDNHRFPVRECDGDSVEQSRGFLQHTTTSTNPGSVTVDTRAIQDSELLRKVEEASRLSVAQKKVWRRSSRVKGMFNVSTGSM